MSVLKTDFGLECHECVYWHDGIMKADSPSCLAGHRAAGLVQEARYSGLLEA